MIIQNQVTENNKSPRRVLYINPTSDNYGVSKVLVEILSLIPKEQYQPIVILPESGPLETELIRLKVEYYIYPLTILRRMEVRGFGFFRFFLSIFPNVIRLVRFLKKEKIDLVHTNASVILDGAFASFVAGLPHIWHIHEILLIESPFFWRIYQRLILSLSTIIICISKVTADQFHDRKKVRIIHNGIDLSVLDGYEHENGEPQNLRKIANGRTTIGLVGRISPRKGQKYLIDCYASLLQGRKYNNTILFIIGDIFRGYEDYLHALETSIKDYGLEHKIIFTGFIDEINNIYPQLDIVVVPSILPEGFGLVIIEAMAARRPVIATASGGALEIIEGDKSGLLISPGDRKALEESLAYLIDHPEERVRIGNAGCERVHDMFDVSKQFEQLLETYEEILG